jgi:hypothetical protein
MFSCPNCGNDMRKKSLVTWLSDMEGGGSPDCDAVNDTRAVKGAILTI